MPEEEFILRERRGSKFLDVSYVAYVNEFERYSSKHCCSFVRLMRSTDCLRRVSLISRQPTTGKDIGA
jgi:hypothetical protein